MSTMGSSRYEVDAQEQAFQGTRFPRDGIE
jgi:hypothetical protein